MRFRFRALALGCGLALAYGHGCTQSTEFECEMDEQCALGDVAGICTEIRHCAYPDDECPSGYKYPDAAGSLGGMCVPGSVSSSAGSTSSTGTMTTTTSTTSSTTTSTSSGDDSTTTVATSSSGGSSGSGTGMACAPDGNDQVATAEDLAVPMCAFDLVSTIDGSGDIDWFATVDLQTGCPEDPGDVRAINVGARLCAYVLCPDPMAVTCMVGTPDAVDGAPGCCTDVPDEELFVGVAGPCDPTEQIFIMLEFDDSEACGTEYTTPVTIF